MKYLVFVQDEFDNNYYIGVYNKLRNAIPTINKWLEQYDTKIEELNAYDSTFDKCFDKMIETPNNEFIMVRGFILNDTDLKPLD